MCTNSCRTFLWRGKGIPSHDEGGLCSCVCEDDSWSDQNILGQASCVPVSAHLIYGGIGLVASMTALFHALYHLRRLTTFHAQNMQASVSRQEKCRRRMHIGTIVLALVGAVYFPMVLGGEMRWSTVVLSTMYALDAFNGLLMTRMWIHDTDPQHIHKSREMLTISNWLQEPVGYYTMLGVFWTVSASSIVLNVAGHTTTGVKLTAWGLTITSIGIGTVYWISGASLRKVINESLENRSRRRSSSGTKEEAERRRSSSGTKEEAVSRNVKDLISARGRAKSITAFAVLQAAWLVAVNQYAVWSKHGAKVPLLMFGVVQGIVPQFLRIFGVQMVASRSRLRPSQGNACSKWLSSAVTWAFSRRETTAIVPIEETMTTAP